MQLILNEYRRRVQTTGATSSRRYPTIRNIHCAYCDPTDTDNNVIVEGFNPATNQLEPVTTISLNTPLKHFGLTMYREKLFIVGGTQDPGYRRDVRIRRRFLLQKPNFVHHSFIADGIVRLANDANQQISARNECVTWFHFTIGHQREDLRVRRFQWRSGAKQLRVVRGSFAVLHIFDLDF